MERYTNNATTTLAASMNSTSNPVTFSPTSTVGFPPGGNFRIIIDNEILLVTAVAGGSWTASRAQEGTAIASHASGAAVTHVLTAASLDIKVTPPRHNDPSPAFFGLYANTGGDDTLNDGSETKPYATIEKVITRLQTGGLATFIGTDVHLGASKNSSTPSNPWPGSGNPTEAFSNNSGWTFPSHSRWHGGGGGGGSSDQNQGHSMVITGTRSVGDGLALVEMGVEVELHHVAVMNVGTDPAVRINQGMRCLLNDVWITSSGGKGLVCTGFNNDGFLVSRGYIINNAQEGVTITNDTYTGTGDMTSGSTTLTRHAGTRQFPKTAQGQAITVAGAGPSGGTLNANVVSVASDQNSCVLDTAASTTVSNAVWTVPGHEVNLGKFSDGLRITGNCQTALLTGTGNITAGSPNLTVTAGSTFSALDLWRPVIIPGAGFAGGELHTFIVTVTDSTHVVLNDSAAATVTGGAWSAYGFGQVYFFDHGGVGEGHNIEFSSMQILAGGQPFYAVLNDGYDQVSLKSIYFEMLSMTMCTPMVAWRATAQMPFGGVIEECTFHIGTCKYPGNIGVLDFKGANGLRLLNPRIQGGGNLSGTTVGYHFDAACEGCYAWIPEQKWWDGGSPALSTLIKNDAPKGANEFIVWDPSVNKMVNVG